MSANWHFDLLARFYDHAIRASDPARLAGLLGLPHAGRLLDAGGGTGRLASTLGDRVGQWVLTDLSLPMLTQAHHKALPGGRVRLAQARVERLPFADQTFSRVVVVDAFHHFADQEQALRELARVLQSGGRLVIEEPDIRRFAVKLIAAGETLALMGSRFRKPAELRAMIASAGLRARVQDDGQNTLWGIGEKI